MQQGRDLIRLLSATLISDASLPGNRSRITSLKTAQIATLAAGNDQAIFAKRRAQYVEISFTTFKGGATILKPQGC
jgi:hypothetical protein